MARVRSWLASASLLGFFLVGGPPQCGPEDGAPTVRLRAVDPNPVGATDPDGDPSQPHPTLRAVHTSRAR